MAGTHVVIDLANSPSFEDKAVLEFSPGLFQPIAADDVAAIVADVALAAPRNGIVEIAGHDAIVPPPVDRARRRMDVVDACGLGLLTHERALAAVLRYLARPRWSSTASTAAPLDRIARVRGEAERLVTIDRRRCRLVGTPAAAKRADIMRPDGAPLADAQAGSIGWIVTKAALDAWRHRQHVTHRFATPDPRSATLSRDVPSL